METKSEKKNSRDSPLTEKTENLGNYYDSGGGSGGGGSGDGISGGDSGGDNIHKSHQRGTPIHVEVNRP